jgi:predicted DNA-binding transcriptional regulator YafY
VPGVWDTSARLLRLLSLLQVRRDWSGRELAERLEVDVRTVRRDVERLRSLGYPVESTTGVAGGYRLAAGAQLPPLLLDDDEAVAVAVGLRTAAGGTVAGIEEASLRALAKLEQVLPARLRHRLQTLGSATVPLPGPRPTVDADLLTVVATACRACEQLRFDYRDHGGATSRRSVEPYHLAHTGRLWYLVAWDLDRRDWRTFRADRIEPVPVPGDRFRPRPPPDGDMAAYVRRSLATAPYQFVARVTFHAPAAVVSERVSPAAGIVEPVDDQTCVVTYGGESLRTLGVFVGMVGVDFTVEEPPELAEHLVRMGERFLRAAAGAGDVWGSGPAPLA